MVVVVSPVQERSGVGHQRATWGHMDLALVSVQHPMMPVVRLGHDVTLPHGHVITLVTPLLSKVQVPIYRASSDIILSLHLVTAIKFKCPRVIEFNFTTIFALNVNGTSLNVDPEHTQCDAGQCCVTFVTEPLRDA